MSTIQQTSETKANGKANATVGTPTGASEPGELRTLEISTAERLYRAKLSEREAFEAKRVEQHERRLVETYAANDARSAVLRALRPGVKAALRNVRGK